MTTQADLDQQFKAFDQQFFDSRLTTGTKVAFHPDLPADEGVCKKDGSLIYVGDGSRPEWERTLLHEMVHAFEHRFPDDLLVTTEGEAASRTILSVIYEPHSPGFFTKLFEIMRVRGHDPTDDFSLYFG